MKRPVQADWDFDKISKFLNKLEPRETQDEDKQVPSRHDRIKQPSHEQIEGAHWRFV